jgi:hypothetical protein
MLDSPLVRILTSPHKFATMAHIVGSPGGVAAFGDIFRRHEGMFGNIASLSFHCRGLVQAGFVTKSRVYEDGKARTLFSATLDGKRLFRRHCEELHKFAVQAAA